MAPRRWSLCHFLVSPTEICSPDLWSKEPCWYLLHTHVSVCVFMHLYVCACKEWGKASKSKKVLGKISRKQKEKTGREEGEEE